MSNVDDRMKVDVFTMPAEDAVQLVLDSYDSDPNGQNPKKLVSSRAVSLIPVDPAQLPKSFKKGRNLIDMNMGELLGLGVLAQLFRQKDNQMYDIVVCVEDAWNPQRETVISDGALTVHGKDNRMIIQQVMAQDLFGADTNSGKIEEEIIKNITDKNSRMKAKEYPKKSGLLVSIYTEQAHIDLHKVMNSIDTTIFPSYYIIRYKMSDLSEAKIYVLGGSAIPSSAIMQGGHFILQRYENPYEKQ
jgi:hypothetical protein